MSPLSWRLIVWPKIRSLVLYWPSHCGNINRPQGLYLGEQSETFPNSLILITCDFNCFPITQIFLFLISTSKHVTSKYLNSTQFEIYFIGVFFFYFDLFTFSLLMTFMAQSLPVSLCLTLNTLPNVPCPIFSPGSYFSHIQLSSLMRVWGMDFISALPLRLMVRESH